MKEAHSIEIALSVARSVRAHLMKCCRLTAGLEVVPNEAISQLPSLDQNSIAAIFGFLPHNSKVLAVKSLSTVWRDWAMLRLKDRANKVSGWVPPWALKQWDIRELTPGQQDAVMRSLAAAGDQEGLTWMHEQLGRLPTAVAMAAAATGQLGVLQWAKEHGCNTGGRHVFQAAACAGHLHILEWLEGQGEGEGDPIFRSWQCCTAQRAADASGNVHMLNWARGKGYTTDPILCRSAVAEGNLEALKGLHEAGTTLGNEVCFIAAEHGQIEVLKWLKEEVGGTWNAEYCLKGAAIYNQLRVLHWAVEEGIPLLKGICDVAASAGHLELLQFAREQGCPWDDETIENSARGGHLQVLQWALEHGCPWTRHAYPVAAEKGKLDVLKWAVGEGLPGVGGICNGAACGGQLEVLKWAREQGFSWGRHICFHAAHRGHVEVLKWAREHGCPWNREACIAAAWREGLDLTGVPGFQHCRKLRRAWGWVCRRFRD